MQSKADKSNSGSIGAPMPGTVQSICVKEGDEVVQGDQLVILNAMKMETVVVSPINGTISKLTVKEGATVTGDDLLLEILES